jgi:hypothetical protein
MELGGQHTHHITLLTEGRLARGRKVDYAAAEEVASSSAASQSRSKNAVEGVNLGVEGGIMGNFLVLGGDRGFRSPEAEPT